MAVAPAAMCIAAPQPIAVARPSVSTSTIPFVTILLLALLVGVFVFQIDTAPVHYRGYELSAAALTGDGAVSGKLVFRDGEW